MSGFSFIFCFYFLPMIVFMVVMAGEADKGAIPYGLIPVFNILFAFISLGTLVHRTFKSGGKCFMGHDFKKTYDSEAEKWKNGRMPARISIGGFEEYCCSNCQTKQTVNWKAF